MFWTGSIRSLAKLRTQGRNPRSVRGQPVGPSLVLHFDTLCAADTTSVIGNKTVAWIHANAKQDEPFFVAAATRAPHAPYLPPPWCAPHIYAVVCKRIAQSINLYRTELLLKLWSLLLHIAVFPR